MHIPVSGFSGTVYRNIPKGYALAVAHKDPRPALAANIRRLRIARQIDQRELGALMDVGQAAVSKWENGGLMDLDILPRLAVTLGATLDQLLAGVDADYDAFAGGRRETKGPRSAGDPFERAILRIVRMLKKDQRLLVLNVARGYALSQPSALGVESTRETSASTPPTRATTRRR